MPLVITVVRRYLRKMVGKRTILAGIFLAALLGGCGDPLRDNANDPGSDRYHPPPAPSPYGTLQVTALRRTGAPIVGAAVSIDDRKMLTDTNGVATIENIPIGQYYVRLTSPQFVEDSTQMKILSDSTSTWSKQLNAIPHFDSVSVTSEVRSLFDVQPDYQYAVRYYAKVSDLDGQGDLPDSAVSVVTPYGSFVLGRIASLTWQRIDTLFPSWGASDLVGKPLQFKASDEPPNPFHSGQSYSNTITLVRTFNATPTLPQTASSRRSQCVVAWNPSQGDGFSYSNRIRFYFPDLQHLYYAVDNLPRVASDTLRNLLPAADYFLTVEEVDEFGNSSRSRTCQFTVTNQ